MKRLGLIVNPLAGIGGKVGLKGSDGDATVKRALELGAIPTSPARAVETLRELASVKGEIELLTYPCEMGETEARESGFEPIVIGSIQEGQTTAHDTHSAAVAMVQRGVDLLLFVGGDGTARDIYNAIGDAAPVLGIPGGVKIHSSVYAVNPRRAADLVKEFLLGRAPVREMEVMDIDEELFRAGRVSARLYGYLKVPFEHRLVQGAKAGSAVSADRTRPLAQHVVDAMDDTTYYVLGSGSTMKAVGEELHIDKTLLGVDVVRQKQLIGKDLNEEQLLSLIDGHAAKIIVTVIGGQGYIFGRGNQQISPRVIAQVGPANVQVVATLDKLTALDGALLVDTGDAECDRSLSGHVRVVTGYNQFAIWKVEA